ncbi:MAG: HlyD family efflux transporter periplasmic adaptor subunit [Acidobacteriota bacterium]
MIAGDDLRRWLPRLGIVTFFLLAWGGWFACGEIRVYEVATEARLESAAEVHPVDAPLGGRIVAVHARLGEAVAAGDPLFDLEAEDAEFELTEAKTRLEALERQLASIAEESDLVARLLDLERAAGQERLRAAGLQQEVETIVGRVAESEHQRARRLHEEGLLSDLDRQRYRGEVEKSRARSEAESADLEALQTSIRGQQTELEARAAHLEHERVTVQGEAAELAAHLEHLQHEIAERRVVAPVAGRVARLAEVQVGAVVATGERLADVLPDGAIRAVAWFPPSALGRLAPGQSAWLRLDAYPWTDFGAVEATVERVADEPNDGRLRAELALAPSPPRGVSPRHGLTATAEVAVETVTPARWVLRAAGGTLDRPVPSGG